MGGGVRNGILGRTVRRLGGVLVAVGRVWAELKAELVSLFRSMRRALVYQPSMSALSGRDSDSPILSWIAGLSLRRNFKTMAIGSVSPERSTSSWNSSMNSLMVRSP